MGDGGNIIYVDVKRDVVVAIAAVFSRGQRTGSAYKGMCGAFVGRGACIRGNRGGKRAVKGGDSVVGNAGPAPLFGQKLIEKSPEALAAAKHRNKNNLCFAEGCLRPRAGSKITKMKLQPGPVQTGRHRVQ